MALETDMPFTSAQVCLLDLDYNLPVQVRDQALAEAGEVVEALPQSDAGREYALNAMSKEGMTTSSFAKAAGNDTIMRLQRTTPYYKVHSSLAPSHRTSTCKVPNHQRPWPDGPQCDTS
jgi:hypothetical protein